MVLLSCLSSVSSHGSHSVCYLMASMGCRCLSLCQMHVILWTSTSTAHYLKSSSVLSGCSGGHPWEKSQLPVDPPQGRLLGLMLCDHQTTIFFWNILAVTPLGSGLNWAGAGTSVLCLADIHTQGNASF